MSRVRNIHRSLLVAGLASVSMSAGAVVLPGLGDTFDGVQVANEYDDFYGYSTELMTELQVAGFMPSEYGVFNFSTGTGTLDVLLYTGSDGQDNQGVGPSGTYNFEDPVHNGKHDPNEIDGQFEGWWGQNDHDNSHTISPDPNPVDHNGAVTVGQMLDYLHEFDPNNNTPFFYADINQTGASPSMYLSIHAYIADPTTLLPIDLVDAAWSMDSTKDHVYDEGDPVYVDNFTAVGNSQNYDIEISKGSGKADFIFFAPGMDLSQYSSDALFVLNGNISGLNNGFEEFFLTGAFSVGTDVPAPAVFWLMGAGLLGLAGARRRR